MIQIEIKKQIIKCVVVFLMVWCDMMTNGLMKAGLTCSVKWKLENLNMPNVSYNISIRPN